MRHSIWIAIAAIALAGRSPHASRYGASYRNMAQEGFVPCRVTIPHGVPVTPGGTRRTGHPCAKEFQGSRGWPHDARNLDHLGGES